MTTALDDELFSDFPGERRIGYADVAGDYLAAGWNPLPVDPLSNKSGVPKGFTGYRGRAVTQADIESWKRTKARHHVSLRMPPGVVGVDVDHYGAKVGADRIAELEADLGPLPPTWTSTSRPGTPSGIRLYRVPVGVRFPTRPCADVEFIQPHHRHAVVAPSTHREGRRYRWYDPTGEEADRFPEIDDLAELPWSWVEHFRRQPAGEIGNVATTERVHEFIDAHTTETFPQALKGPLSRLNGAKGSRHDSLLEVTCWAVREAAAGLYSAERALGEIWDWWQHVVDIDRLDGTEFGDAVAWAIGQVDADPARIASIRLEHQQRERNELRSLIADAGADQRTGEVRLGLPDDFWRSRPVLEHVRRAAWSRMVAPDATLIAVLARLAALVPPTVRLPAIVGSEATLDFIGSNVAHSSGGKSVAGDVGADLLPSNRTDVLLGLPIGSGEGLVQSFFVPEIGDDGKPTGQQVIGRSAVHFVVDEGTALLEQSKRSGTTITQTLCSAWSGRELGQTNAKAETRRIIEARRVRVAAVINIQVSNGHLLLSPEMRGIGLPQRITFATAHDPSMPAVDQLPDWPGPLDYWTPPSVMLGTTFDVHPDVRDEIRRARHDVATGVLVEPELDGHLRLMRLKIAALLAVLDHRTGVDLDDWALAGNVIASSVRVRDRLVIIQQTDETARRQRSAVSRAEYETTVDDVKERKAISKLADAIIRRVTSDGIGRGELSRTVTSSATRHRFDDALRQAIERGLVIEEDNRVRAI